MHVNDSQKCAYILIHICVCIYNICMCYVLCLFLFSGPQEKPKLTSQIVKSAWLHRNQTKLTVDCEFVDDNPDATCVLLYHEPDSTQLKVAEFRKDFPASLTVDQSVHSFFLFGKTSTLEQLPVLKLKRDDRSATYPPPSDPGEYISVHVINLLQFSV